MSKSKESSVAAAAAADVLMEAAGTTAVPAHAARRAELPCHILLVEDHLDTASMMERLLARRGYRVTHAATIADALAAAREHAFDLLLADLGLPDGSGLDLMREFSRRMPKVRGIALSGFGMPDDPHRSLEAGFTEHLTKPLAVEQLWSTLDRMLARCAAPRR